MDKVTMGSILDQDPKVLFQENNNIHFFTIVDLIKHQKYLNENDKTRKINLPKTGDAVRLPDGSYRQLFNLIHSDGFQLTYFPVYIYIDKSYRTYSGGYDFTTEQYWSTIHNLKLTGRIKRNKVWSFCAGNVKPGNGVSWVMYVPVWELKK